MTTLAPACFVFSSQTGSTPPPAAVKVWDGSGQMSLHVLATCFVSAALTAATWQLDQLTEPSTSGTSPPASWRLAYLTNTGDQLIGSGTRLSQPNSFTFKGTSVC